MDSRILSTSDICSTNGCAKSVTAHRLGLCEDHYRERRRAQGRNSVRRLRETDAEATQARNRDDDQRRRIRDDRFVPVLIGWRNPDCSMDYWLVSSGSGKPTQVSPEVFKEIVDLVYLTPAESRAFEETMDWIELLLHYRDKGQRVKFKGVPQNISLYGLEPSLHQWFTGALRYWTTAYGEFAELLYYVYTCLIEEQGPDGPEYREWKPDPRRDLGDFISLEMPIKRGVRAAGTKIKGYFACRLLAAWGRLLIEESYRVEVERLVQGGKLEEILGQGPLELKGTAILERYGNLTIGVAAEDCWEGLLDQLRSTPAFLSHEGYDVDACLDRSRAIVASRYERSRPTAALRLPLTR